MDISENSAPNIAFLGVCERAEYIRQGHPATWKYNILGLKNTSLSYIFPFNLKGNIFLFGIHDQANFKEANIKITDYEGRDIMYLKIQSKIETLNNSESDTVLDSINNVSTIHNQILPWSLFLYTVDTDIILNKPDNFKVILDTGGKEVLIGLLAVAGLRAPPFTTEYIAAIKANPLACKQVKILIGCKNCSQKLTAYASLERDKKLEDEGEIWFENLPNIFKCKCDLPEIDLQYIRNNLHALLSFVKSPIGEILSTRLYDNDALNNICQQFKQLIDKKPPEEEVQKFIEKYPILLQQFSPEKLFFKKSILNFFVTDFCVLNNKKGLLFIEIEKPETPLMKKNGEVKSEMHHAMNQVRGWLHKAKEERSAVIKGIGLKPDDVTNIRGVVILGRDCNHDKEKLRELKGHNFGDITFFTYDDILNSLVSLIRTVNTL